MVCIKALYIKGFKPDSYYINFCQPGSEPDSSYINFCQLGSKPNSSYINFCQPGSKANSSYINFCQPGSKPNSPYINFCQLGSKPNSYYINFCLPVLNTYNMKSAWVLEASYIDWPKKTASPEMPQNHCKTCIFAPAKKTAAWESYG